MKIFSPQDLKTNENQWFPIAKPWISGMSRKIFQIFLQKFFLRCWEVKNFSPQDSKSTENQWFPIAKPWISGMSRKIFQKFLQKFFLRCWEVKNFSARWKIFKPYRTPQPSRLEHFLKESWRKSVWKVIFECWPGSVEIWKLAAGRLMNIYFLQNF